jgi:hypothetical protein
VIADAMDNGAVEAAALAYLDAWYAGDAEAMLAAVHPDLAKRTIRTMPDGGRQIVEHMSANLLAEVTRTGRGSLTSPGERLRDVQVLDVTGGMAIVKATSARFIDYLHLAVVNGRWVIVNALWAPREGSP